MLIQNSKNNTITITVSSSIDKFGLQRLIEHLKYLEATSKSKAQQTAIDELADEVNSSWWEANKTRFIK
nr:hypothetical protein [Mucilaginibacter sp. X4EP1]